MKRIAVVGCLLVELIWLDDRRVLTKPQTPAPPLTVEAAEAEGSNYPKSGNVAERAGYREAFGPTDRKCVEAEGHVTARSGEFIAGPFDRHVLMGNPRNGTPPRKVWWVPQATLVPPMLLRATKIASPAVTVTRTFPEIASTANGSFFPTTFRFPAIGKWLVVVTSGNNWGCFLLDEIEPL